MKLPLWRNSRNGPASTTHMLRCQSTHKKGKTDRRGDKPFVKKVAAKAEAPASEPVEAPSEETKTEE